MSSSDTIKTPDNLQITARQIEADFESALKNKADWHSNDIVISHFFSGLQATFPEGERFFIDAARDVRDNNKEKLPEKLLPQIQAFIQQEAFHGQTHDAWGEALINLGFTRMRDFDNELKELRINAKEEVPAMLRLSITSAVEHYTASLAHLFLRQRRFIDGASNPFKQVMLYHALEEVEHKAVCYDLFKAAGGSYRLRIIGLLIASADVAYQGRKRHIYLLKKSGQWNLKNRIKAWKLIWGWNGIIHSLLPYTLRYLKPGFHPWETDERKDLNERYADDFAAAGMSVY
jgi:predicted metal-dependent hydrolase